VRLSVESNTITASVLRCDEVIDILRQQREAIFAFHVTSLFLFGSVARNQAKASSDVDLLVEFLQPVGLFALARLQIYLEKLLGCAIDIGTPDSLKPYMQDLVMEGQSMSYRSTSWDEFIAEIAKSKISSPRLYKTFTFVFSEIGRDKTVEECSEQLLDQSVKTIGEHLGQIYKLFDADYPELKNQGKSKRQALTEYLLRLYETQKGSNNDISDRLLSSPNPQNISTPESILELTTLEFIGRDRDLTNLANLSRHAKIVLIKAGAGVGKSTLAREFLQTNFKKVIRIEMGLESGNVTPAEEKVSQILRKDFDEEPSRDFGINLDILREKLGDRANPIGVLIDNLEPALDENYRFREKLRGYDDLLMVLGDRDVFAFTLITSRRSLTTPRAKVYEYSLEGLDITAWRQYFHDCENGSDSEALLQMHDAYNGNAKVMDILHGAIKNRFDGNIGAYWSRYKDALLADSELETLISVEMDWLRDNQPNAYKLLCRMGCYRYQDVKTVPFEGLICLLWDVPESNLTRIVQDLSKSSLIEDKNEEYYLHPAVREIAKSRLLENKPDWDIVNQKAAEFWEGTISDESFFKNYINIFESFHHYYLSKKYKEAFLVFSKKINENIYERNRYAYLRFWGESNNVASCLKRLQNHLEDIDKAQLIGTIGACYYYSNSFSLAIEFLKNAEELIKSGGDYRLKRLYSVCHNYLARAHRQRGDLQTALEYCKSAIGHLQKIDSLEESKIKKEKLYKERIKSNILRSYACIYYDLGFYKRSRACSQASFKCSNYEEETKILHREVGDSLAYEALAYFAQGNEREAIAKMLKSISEFQKVKDYLSEGYARCYLIRFYLKENLLERANNEISNVQRIYDNGCKSLVLKARLCGSKAQFNRKQFQNTNQKEYGDQAINEHLDSINILCNIECKPLLAEEHFQLGLTYQAMGEHDQAKEYKEKALELFAQMEAPKQIERVNKAFEQGAVK